jgi:hypothetical protein
MFSRLYTTHVLGLLKSTGCSLKPLRTSALNLVTSCVRRLSHYLKSDRLWTFSRGDGIGVLGTMRPQNSWFPTAGMVILFSCPSFWNFYTIYLASARVSFFISKFTFHRAEISIPIILSAFTGNLPVILQTISHLHFPTSLDAFSMCASLGPLWHS